MQQTDKYKLNLIEKTDTFSPDPLNDNMRKVEAQFDAARAEANAAVSAEAQARASAVSAEAAARASADSALDSRVTELEIHSYVVGYAPGSGDVILGFTPKAVLAFGGNGFSLVTEDRNASGLQIIEGGFSHSGYFINSRYVAFG